MINTPGCVAVEVAKLSGLVRSGLLKLMLPPVMVLYIIVFFMVIRFGLTCSW